MRHAVINLIHTRHKKKTKKQKLLAFCNNDKWHFTEFKTVCKYYQQNNITRKVNESILRAREYTLRYAHASVRCSKCNYCTKMMHTRYFRVIWVSWIQIGFNMRVVYAECMKKLCSMMYRWSNPIITPIRASWILWLKRNSGPSIFP